MFAHYVCSRREAWMESTRRPFRAEEKPVHHEGAVAHYSSAVIMVEMLVHLMKLPL